LDAGFDENNGIENSKVVVFLCHGSPGCFPKQEPRNDLEICVCDVNKKSIECVCTNLQYMINTIYRCSKGLPVADW
jgi:hypothetical protein